MMDQDTVSGIFGRQDSQSGSGNGGSGSSTGSTGNEFLDLIADPFSSQVDSNAVAASLGFSLGFAVIVALLFCLLRPYNSVVYAPRAKHADSKHAPPPVSKGLFSWIPPLIRTKEPDMIEKVGLDAALFMRFTRMFRNIFLILSFVGCAVIIPTNVICSRAYAKMGGISWFSRTSAQYVTIGSKGIWTYVACAYIFDIVICYFLWRNYGAVVKLRRDYLEGPEYQKSLHARTLLMTDIPQDLRSDDGIVRIIDQVRATEATPRTAIARNVKDLPDLVEEHEEAVRALESILSKYLKNPDKLPASRPTCKPSKHDKGYSKDQKVDAIEYLSARIKELEIEIKEVRQTVDKRNALPYGFASYTRITDAHATAYVAKKKAPHNTIVRLAPRPNDLVWRNLPMLKKQRQWNNFINNAWVAVLTVLWIVPNILIAVFLSSLKNLAAVWKGFEPVYNNPDNKWWIAIVQGVVAPGLTSLFYYYLPAIFRRLCINSGDVTKTSRERHVMDKLYAFFTFNNLILFSLFSAVFQYIWVVVDNSKSIGVGKAIVEGAAFKKMITALSTVSPYWLSWLLQRNLGAAIDLSQLVNLAWGGFSRKYLSPTPRQMIELSAPQPFEYAGYYNYFLFYATVAMTFAVIQPLVLPVTAFYFYLDSFLKKYLLLYVFITKYESGGMFWIALFNRVLFLTLFGNIIIALYVVAFGSLGVNWAMLGTLIPLPFLLAGFKFYCMRMFDDKLHYYDTGRAMSEAAIMDEREHKSKRLDKVGVRFGHPALYKPLMTPMVSSKAQHRLRELYLGRLSEDDGATVSGFSDVYMDNMDVHKLGKASGGNGPFEFVSEHELDFEHWKDRPEFRDEAGGDGQLYGRPEDISRGGTPSTMMSRAGTMDSDWQSRSGSQSRSQSNSRSHSVDSAALLQEGGVVYPKGYHQTPSQQLRDYSPAGSERDRLVHGAAGMGRGGVGRATPPGMATPLPTPGGYGPVRTLDNTPPPRLDTPPGLDTPGIEGDTSYEYFRRGRQL